MIIVSVAYVICYFPNNIYFIIVDPATAMTTGIYAVKHEGVKDELFRLMAACRTCRVGGNVVAVALGNTGNTSGSVQTSRPKQTQP